MNIFENLLSVVNIFKNRDVLRHSYNPEKLPHREEQINQLALLLSPLLRGGTPSNIFIYGKTGTGKTATVKFVGRQLEEASKKAKQNVVVHYINCEIVDTAYRVLASIARKFGSNVPMTGWPTDQVYDEVKKVLERKRARVLIILDEIDKLVKKAEEALYGLTRINSELENSSISLIGISNNLKFKNFLDARVLSSLSEEEIVFPPYNAGQLEDILMQRAKMAFEDGVLEEGVIQLCAAYAAQEHGDARKALDLLRVSAEIAERERDTKVRVEHVKKARRKIETDYVIETVRTLPIHSKILLYSMALISETSEKFTTGEVYCVYKKLCNRVGVDSLTQRRISDLISELDMLGVVNSVIISKGRYGRTREMKLETDDKALRRVLEEDYRLQSLKNYEGELRKFASLKFFE
ncbi:ORC1-type DNA replication protein [Archaeoglobus neptunius]|uniref:ORC1-type DNA replication protein n=1 Tax=Archaeoglobus neptunius TaxID=2798580 RepID=UPI00192558B3|nr:ORC1-type DNA replication protein [Archaeoglobus neptunius]